MYGNIAQLNLLTKLNDIPSKLEYINGFNWLEDFGVVFFSRKTLIKSIGGLEYFAQYPIQTEIGLEELIYISIKQFNKLGLNKKFKSNSTHKVILKNLYLNQESIGYVYLKIEREPGNDYEHKVDLIYHLASHFEAFINSKNQTIKANNNKKILSNKMLEIESLIDLTDIIFNQQENTEGFFENILFTFISTLNASSGMILIKDEKSSFFNLVSIFNIEERFSSKKIIRANKGILKKLNNEKISILEEEINQFELLSFVEKNALIGPLTSENKLRGAIIIGNKESLSGITRFTKEDLRLFDSLTKKVSLAYQNIKLIDSLKTSTKLVDNIMSSITTGIIKIDQLGEVEYVNQAAENVFGFSQKSVLHNHYMAIFMDNEKLISLIERIEMDPKVVYENNLRVINLKEEEHEINLTLSPVFDDSNEFSGLVLAFEDLSNINKVKSTFKKYVSENIVDELLKTDESLKLGGGKNKVCILFCDIRGFTAMSEKMIPEDVVSLLNHYFQEMIDVVFDNNGTLDKIIGDELMVLYGVPIESENDAQKAVDTAQQMFIKLKEFNEDNKSMGLPKIKIGIGINYGEVISGNIGSDRQMNYTVIGDNVNLAARLCSHAKPSQIVISRSVYEKLDDKSDFKKMDAIELKGKSKKIENWIMDMSN
ncbi:MAG: adenylate/guanylate cyclase domain-containing protein [Flavobacteriaceae bacterium]